MPSPPEATGPPIELSEHEQAEKEESARLAQIASDKAIAAKMGSDPDPDATVRKQKGENNMQH